MHPFLDLAIIAGIMALGQFSPGPDMILLTRTSLAQGARAGAIMACGIATGLAVHTGLAVGGLAVIFDRMPKLLQALGWVAAAYLLYLSYLLLKSALAKPVAVGAEAIVPPAPKHGPFLRGLFCNLLNPKAAIFIASITAKFLKGPHPDWMPVAIWAVIVGQAVILWAAWAALLQWPPLRTRYERSTRWIDGAFGVALLVLAVELIWRG
ncbi:MAG: Lysine exporter protein [Akkermansiaceae bacterium]|nr:Lysine exporter protein [Akkermansiaceae bacterium]